MANLKNIPKGVIKIRVARPSILASSGSLFQEFIRRRGELEKKYGKGSVRAHNQALKDINWESKFRQEILNNPEAIKKLKEIKELAKKKDVYIWCWEKRPKVCHRFVLLELIKDI